MSFRFRGLPATNRSGLTFLTACPTSDALAFAPGRRAPRSTVRTSSTAEFRPSASNVALAPSRARTEALESRFLLHANVARWMDVPRASVDYTHSRGVAAALISLRPPKMGPLPQY